MPAVTVISDTAQAVLDALTAGLIASAFSQPFLAERSYADWEWPLDDEAAADLRCDVVPVNNPKTELDGRDSLEYTIAVDLVLRQKLGTVQRDDVTGRLLLPPIDNLVGLLLELHEYFCIDRFEDLPDFAWQSTEIRAAFVSQHLRQHAQYTGVLRLGFVGSRGVGS